MKVTKFKKGKYEIDNKKAHITTKDLIQFIDNNLTKKLTAEEITTVEKYSPIDLRNLTC